MGNLLHVKLGDGRRVRDPLSSTVMKSGDIYRVPPNQFWLRRLAAGDVVSAESEAVQELKSEEAKSKPLASKKKEKSGE